MTRAHLTEDERQGFADGSLDDTGADHASRHLASCVECAADVARLRTLVSRARASSAPQTDLDALWPGIRSRIEAAKIVPLAATAPSSAPPRGRITRTHWTAIGIAAAAAVLAVGIGLTLRANRAPVPRVATAPQLTTINDSARLYRDEAERLLRDLELRRAMLRPETRASIDSDLRTIDAAIAELEAAIAHDPNNAALRQLLASSYRQKVELLVRVNNAG
jgi:hypothetical protein